VIKEYVPAELKARYINSLLKAGFHAVETGSMASSRIIPQMADTLDVLAKLDLSVSKSEIMVLVFDKKGAEIISQIDEVSCISYPFSVSPTFTKNNLNTTISQSIGCVDEIINICHKAGKTPVIYISMAFGNHYGDKWNIELLFEWIRTLKNLGAGIISLSNVSVDIAPELIKQVFAGLYKYFPDLEFGLHLHTGENNCEKKINAAYNEGCRRFDTVINGNGGCPMSDNILLSNLNTVILLKYLEVNDIKSGIDIEAIGESLKLAELILNPIGKVNN
jgi:hydroxymethylglutaryl-CoA lyase